VVLRTNSSTLGAFIRVGWTEREETSCVSRCDTMCGEGPGGVVAAAGEVSKDESWGYSTASVFGITGIDDKDGDGDGIASRIGVLLYAQDHVIIPHWTK